jgi:hypothetical protein
MATIKDALKDQFWKDCKWFNDDEFRTGPVDQYERFEDAVRMKKIDDPGEYHEKKSAVRNYFETTGTDDKATFDPDTGAGELTFEVVGQLGFVSGTANFRYRTVANSGGPATPKRRIAYSFTYSSVSGEWKLLHLWGQYINEPTASTRRVTKLSRRSSPRRSRHS